MTDLLRTFEETLLRHHLLKPGNTVIIGVSGGPDSVALLHLFTRLRSSWQLHLHVAHLHHGIRGEEADMDAAFVADLASRWNVPCTVERLDIPTLAQQEHVALEEAARRHRYAFLARVARHQNADTLAVGHHADDQAETVLMHLLRGSGPAGLRGMAPKTPLSAYRVLPIPPEAREGLTLIRPLLFTSRATIATYCAAYQLPTRADSSNQDTTFFRNRLRHDVLPYLARINPRIRERLCALAEVLRADYELLETLTQQAWDTLLIEQHANALSFDLVGYRALPLSLQRALIRRAAYTLRPTLRDVDFTHVDPAVRIATTGITGDQATLPRGLLLTLGYDRLTIAHAEARPLPTDRPCLPPGTVIPLPTEGYLTLSNGWTLTLDRLNHWDLETITANPDPLTAYLDADALHAPLHVRTRRPGDRFAPLALGAEVNLGDFFVRAKIPAPWRDALPLLCGGDTILWVVGIRLSDAARVTPTTRQVLRCRFRKEPPAPPETSIAATAPPDLP